MSGPENRWAFAVCKDKLGKDGNIECGIIESIKLGPQKPDVKGDKENIKKLGRFITKQNFIHITTHFQC